MVDHKNESGGKLYQQLKDLPKIELHRHLEGSLRLDTLCDIANEHDIDLPSYEVDALRPFVQIVASDPASSEAFLSKFVHLREFFKSPKFIRRMAYEAVADAAADNVKYMELRFTPKALAATQGYSFEDVTDWVLDTSNKAAAELGIVVKHILSMNRNESVQIGERVARLAVDRMDQGVVGLDLAGDEANYLAAPFAPIFRAARQAGLNLTIHAGEWAGAESVRETIDEIGPSRIGHGVNIIQDSQVVQMALDRGIALEVCVTSNVQSGTVGLIEKHPLRDLYQLSLLTTINTDDPSVSNITLTDEFAIVMKSLNMRVDDIKAHVINAAKVAFLPDDQREDLVATFGKLLADATF